MDKLEQRLRESSEQVRPFEPPPGQWEKIQEQLAQPAAGPASDSGGSNSTGGGAGSGAGAVGPGIWWSGLLPIGLIVTSICGWAVIKENTSLAEQASLASATSISQPVTSPVIAADELIAPQPTEESIVPQTAATPSVNPSLQSATSVTDDADRTVEQSRANNSNFGGSVAGSEEPSTYANPTTTLPQSSPPLTDSDNSNPGGEDSGTAPTPAENTDLGASTAQDLAPTESNTASAATDERLTEQTIANSRLVVSSLEAGITLQPLVDDFPVRQQEGLSATVAEQTILPTTFEGSGYSYDQENSPWRQRHPSGPRWEVDFHVLALPMYDFNSVNEYSTEVIPGAPTFTTDFDGNPLTLYRLSDGNSSIADSWFTSFHAGISRRFSNGLRLGFGLSYVSNDILQGSLDEAGFINSTPDIYLRYSQDSGSLFFGSITAEYMFWRRRRFRATVGGSLLLPFQSSERYSDRLYHPFTDRDEILSRGIYVYDYVVDSGAQFFPQLGLEYQLGQRTTLSVSAGARLGLGLRYRVGKR